MSKKNEFASMDLLSAFNASQSSKDKVKLSDILLNPNQPRVFNKEAVDDLVESMSRLGLIEPIIIRQENGKYILVAGERRYRAAKKLGWDEIPAKIVDASSDVCYEMALAENEKRKSLNPWEVGRAILFLRKEKKKTATEVSKILGYTERYIKQLSSIARLDQRSVEDLITGGNEPSIKNLEKLLRQKEGRVKGGEMVSPLSTNTRIRISINLHGLAQKKREGFLKELNVLKTKYGIK